MEARDLYSTTLFDLTYKDMLKGRRGARGTSTSIKIEPETCKHPLELLVASRSDVLQDKVLVKVLNNSGSANLFDESSLLLPLFLSDNFFVTFVWVVVVKQRAEPSESRFSEDLVAHPREE